MQFDHSLKKARNCICKSIWLCSVDVDEVVLKRCTTSVNYTQMSVCKENIFLETVPEECCQKQVIKFIEATGRDMTKTLVCAICAGCFFSKELCPVNLEELNQQETTPCFNASHAWFDRQDAPLPEHWHEGPVRLKLALMAADLVRTPNFGQNESLPHVSSSQILEQSGKETTNAVYPTVSREVNRLILCPCQLPVSFTTSQPIAHQWTILSNSAYYYTWEGKGEGEGIGYWDITEMITCCLRWHDDGLWHKHLWHAMDLASASWCQSQKPEQQLPKSKARATGHSRPPPWPGLAQPLVAGFGWLLAYKPRPVNHKTQLLDHIVDADTGGLRFYVGCFHKYPLLFGAQQSDHFMKMDMGMLQGTFKQPMRKNSYDVGHGQHSKQMRHRFWLVVIAWWRECICGSEN